jgi:hypothetical protein
VVSQIAERGGEIFLSGEAVFVDPQHPRTAVRMPFPELAAQAMPEVAFDVCRSDAFPSAPGGCG